MKLDPRCESTDKLTPPFPLPYISRRALKRVKDWLPPPTQCTYCAGSVELVENSAIYNGRSYGKWPYAYLCRPCDALVGLHPDTDLPLGTMANRPLREARKKAKDLWQTISEDKGMRRTQAYSWLSQKMDIPLNECHFGHFNIERAKLALTVCEQYLANHLTKES